MSDWPHQVRAHAEVTSSIEFGDRSLCVTSPTGGGKTRMMLKLLDWASETRRRAVLYTNRRLLLDQVQNVLDGAGVGYGIRAAGYKPDRDHVVQVASIQTEHTRVHRLKTWAPCPADLVLVDEAHQQASPAACEVIDAHKRAGAAIVGFTATPIDLAHVYRRLIVAGTTSELRACGALVPAEHYGPDEPDFKSFKGELPPAGDDLTAKQIRGLIMRPGIFGRVKDALFKYNPDLRPTILFGPDVAGSLWFAEHFHAAGIPAAHIDGNWISYGETMADGSPVLIQSNRANREELLAKSQSGEIVVICNRYVLREGIDAPWISHGIFATVIGSLSSYLQAGGRLLRAHPSLDHVTVQDHGGNWWRHGSLNSDRSWDLTWTTNMIAGVRAENLRNKSEPEPICCPQCKFIRKGGRQCPRCGYVPKIRSRDVVQSDGSLRPLTGDIFKPRRQATASERAQQDWEKIIHRARSKKWDATFAQAEAMFAKEHNWAYPPRSLRLMPIEPADWFRKVRDVPTSRLR